MMRPSCSLHGLVVLAVGMSVSACASLSGLGGTSEYGCKAPAGVRCDSVSGNYFNSIQHNLPSQRLRHQPETSDPTAISKVSTSPSSKTSALNASPLRSPIRVLRLWFKPWEDADHDFVDQGYVYVQIDNGRWLIDHVHKRIRDAYAPIRAPQAGARSTSDQSKPSDPRSPDTGAPTERNNSAESVAKPLPDKSNPPADESK